MLQRPVDTSSVDAAVRERQFVHVALVELYVRATGEASSCAIEHARIVVDPDHGPARSDRLGEAGEVGAGAAAQINDALARTDVQRGMQALL